MGEYGGMSPEEHAIIMETEGMSPEEHALMEERAKLEDEIKAQRLDAFGLSLAITRSEAIKARKESGIEDIWLEDEEFYEGIDDANRSEHQTNLSTKPPGQGFPAKSTVTGSTVFPNITAPYVNAAAAKVSDMSMPTDNANFDLKPTPIAENISLLTQQQPDAMAGQQPAAPGAPAAPVEGQQQAEERAKKAKKRLEDWMVECQYHSQLRLVIKDAARIGSGVIKGPVPEMKRHVAYVNGAIEIKEEIKPVSKRIDPWNLYPDGSCGDSIHNGSYIWERSYLTEKQLEDLKGSPGYLDSQIDRCIEEGPQRALAEVKKEPDSRREIADKKRYEAWFFYGRAKREDIEAAGCACGEDQPSIPAMVVMVNNHVIKASFNPLDSGEFPYDVLPWQVVSGSPWGKGIARLARTAQRIVVASFRALMNNMGMAAGPMWLYKQGVVNPIDGKYVIAPLKGWAVAEDADITDVSRAFAYVIMPTMQVELNNVIQMGMKLAEDSTGLPMLMQGQMGSAPDTVGGMQILNNNGSTVLRALGRALGDYIEEPHVRRYYNWLLQYGEDDEKGDFTIDARGSMVNIERAIQNQEMIGILQLSANPAYGISTKKAVKEYLISRSFDPKAFEMDEDEKAQFEQQAQPDPRLQVAQLNAQAQGEVIKFKQEASDQAKQREMEFKAALEQQRQQFEAEENAKNRELEMAVAVINERMSTAGLSSQERATLASIKARLAETAVKVNLSRELSATSTPKQVLTPPVEPEGRAPDGQAYAR